MNKVVKHLDVYCQAIQASCASLGECKAYLDSHAKDCVNEVLQMEGARRAEFICSRQGHKPSWDVNSYFMDSLESVPGYCVNCGESLERAPTPSELEIREDFLNFEQEVHLGQIPVRRVPGKRYILGQHTNLY